jgi:chemotaxis-related protein WspD
MLPEPNADLDHTREKGALARYAQQLSELTARHKAEYEATDSSAILFRIGQEQFAFPTVSVREVVERPRIHRVPRVDNPSILGLANVRGGLLLCFSLSRLLRIAEVRRGAWGDRLLVLSWHNSHLGCPVDEILGVSRFRSDQIRPAPHGLDLSGALVLGILEVTGQVSSVLSVDTIFALVGSSSAH